MLVKRVACNKYWTYRTSYELTVPFEYCIDGLLACARKS